MTGKERERFICFVRKIQASKVLGSQPIFHQNLISPTSPLTDNIPLHVPTPLLFQIL